MENKPRIERRPVGNIITSRARALVRDYFAAMASGAVPDNLTEILQRLFEVGGELVPALTEAVDFEDPRERFLAAWFLSCLRNERPTLVPERTWGRAEQRLLDVFGTSDIDLQLMACTLFSLSAAPDRLVASLRNLLKHDDDRLKVGAAMALSRGGVESQLMASPVLLAAFRGNKKDFGACAGCALLRMGMHLKEVVPELAERFPKMSEETQFVLLTMAKLVGKKAIGLFEPIAGVLADRRVNPELRRQAASTLGHIAVGTERAAPHLLAAMASPKWQVIYGALEGYEAGLPIPFEMGSHLAGLLSNSDPQMRGTAAIGLAAMGDRVTHVLPELISQLIRESNLDVCRALATAIGAMGPAAISPLLELVHTDDAGISQRVMQALTATGPDGARAMAEILPTITNDQIRMHLVFSLMNMGKRAAPAVPVLAKMLTDTAEEQLGLNLIMALHMCGDWAAPAIPALIDCICVRDEDDAVSTWAIRLLGKLGRGGLASLQQAAQNADGDAKRRLDRVLESIHPAPVNEFADLERLNDDALLASFVIIGDIFVEFGEISQRKLERFIAEGIAKGTLVWPGGGTTQNALAGHLTRLAKRLGLKPLTDQAGTTKGGLSDEGKRLLARVKTYFLRKAGQGHA